MSPLIMQIIWPLCAAFVLGILVGWLAKQLHTTDTVEQLRKTWEERLRRQWQEVEATRNAAQTSTVHIQQLQEQLTAANNERERLDVILVTRTKELATKASECTALETQLREAQEKSVQNIVGLSEERHHALRLEEELKSLRKNLVDKTEIQIQLSQRLKEQEAQRGKMREHEVNSQLQRSRLEFTLRSKETETQQLQDRLATFETQQRYLNESNNNLRHSCARYQSDLHEKDAELERLHARIDHLETHPMPPGSSTTLLPMPDLRAHMDMQDKDAEIARLRARIAGLQLLLRRGANRLQPVTGEVPVDVARNASPK